MRPGARITPPAQVAVRDAFGNTVTGFSGTVTVGIRHDASVLGTARLSGTTTVAVVAGIASFSDLSIDQIGTGYTLTAGFGGGLPVASAPLNVL